MTADRPAEQHQFRVDHRAGVDDDLADGSAEQLRSQLGLAHLQEVSAQEVPAVTDAGQPPADNPAVQLRFRW